MRGQPTKGRWMGNRGQRPRGARESTAKSDASQARGGRPAEPEGTSNRRIAGASRLTTTATVGQRPPTCHASSTARGCAAELGPGVLDPLPADAIDGGGYLAGGILKGSLVQAAGLGFGGNVDVGVHLYDFGEAERDVEWFKDPDLRVLDGTSFLVDGEVNEHLVAG